MHFCRTLLIVSLFPIVCNGQKISIVAGTGERGYSGDSSLATMAELNQPIAVAIDDSGNLFIVDVGSDHIRKVDANGVVSTVMGKPGINSDDLPWRYIRDGQINVNDRIWKPHDVITDKSGNIYYSEFEGGTIRKISKSGIVSTVAGRSKKWRTPSDSTLAINEILPHINSIAIDNSGSIFFTCEGYNKIYRISPTGVLSLIAGTGRIGYSGDGGLGTEAELNHPWGIALDSGGTVLISDMGNNVIRKIDANGVITTIAGTGIPGYEGDSGIATKATLNEPRGVAINNLGTIFIADTKNNAVRQITRNGIISTLVGAKTSEPIKGEQTFKADSDLRNVTLNYPYDVSLDNEQNLYIADDQNHVIRKVTFLVNKVPFDSTNAVKGNSSLFGNSVSIKASENHQLLIEDLSNGYVSVSADIVRKALIVKIADSAYTEYTITSSKGEELKKGRLCEGTSIIDTENIANGRYQLNLFKGAKRKTIFFVKN